MNGILLINKPQDFTSFDVVAVVRRLVSTKKVGHTGTLDPFATGVLPIMIGSCTKLCDILPISQKRYTATVQLGVCTDTLDITGTVKHSQQSCVTVEQLQNVLPLFRGEISQIPPMYSAIKINGQRMYDLARQGIEVERAARTVTISRLDLLAFDQINQRFTIDVACSKGTYIRSLSADIASALDTIGCVSVLNRTEACGYDISQCVDLKLLRGHDDPCSFIAPVSTAVSSFRAINVSVAQAHRFLNGGWLDIKRLTIHDFNHGDFVRVYDNDTLLGVGYIDLLAGVVKMKCLLKE